jgi:cytochrome c biogenesis protein CcdA
LFYIFAVFITYFLVGIGIFEFVRQLNAFKIFSTIFKHALTIVLLCLALFSLYDFIQSLKGKTEKMILKLPIFLQQSIRKNIRNQMTDYKILLGSLILGFTVSIVELVCTGQVYFPIIGYMVRNSGEQIKGIILLLFYNTAFIIPLGLTFLLVFFGISSKKIGDLFSKYLAVVKFLFFLLFVSFTIINIIL